MGLLLGAVAAGAPTAARALRRRLFALHDRSRLEVFCYSLRQSDRSAPRAAVESAAEHFVDVSSSDSAAIAAQIATDGIHVCVDLNGFTSGARTELFALRPSPLHLVKPLHVDLSLLRAPVMRRQPAMQWSRPPPYGEGNPGNCPEGKQGKS